MLELYGVVNVFRIGWHSLVFWWVVEKCLLCAESGSGQQTVDVQKLSSSCRGRMPLWCWLVDEENSIPCADFFVVG